MGDAVDGGREAQYPVYLKTREKIGKPVHEIPGNQDRVLCLMHGHFHNELRGWDDHAPVHEIVFPSTLYNRDRRLEEQNAPGYNLSEFRPGYTLVTIDKGMMQLSYQPVGVAESQEKSYRLNQLDQASTGN